MILNTSKELMMTLYEFGLLHVQTKINLVYREGVYIGKIKEDNARRVLYQLNSFYVEISYRKYRHHIRHIRSFTSTFLLDPYLEGIAIENMVGF